MHETTHIDMLFVDSQVFHMSLFFFLIQYPYCPSNLPHFASFQKKKQLEIIRKNNKQILIQHKFIFNM